jgi:hypothetical protein
MPTFAPASDPENLKRLAAALRDLQARVYTEAVPEGLPCSCDDEPLTHANVWSLTTDAGRLDVIVKPSGTDGYDDLARSAVTYQAFGIELRAASLKDILRSKLASNRAQDQHAVIILTEMLKRR